jgi:hypothetical protein
MDTSKPKPATQPPSATLTGLFQPGKTLSQQDWKQYKYDCMLSSPTQDVQVLRTVEKSILIVSCDKIIAHVEKSAQSKIDLMEVVAPIHAGPQKELGIVACVKLDSEKDTYSSALRLYKATSEGVKEPIDKAISTIFDIPKNLGCQIIATMFESGHYVGFDMSLDTKLPSNKPDLLHFCNDRRMYAQKIITLGPNSTSCLGQFEGAYFRLYDLKSRKWMPTGFNLDFSVDYISRAILLGSSSDGHLIIDSGVKFLVINLGPVCSVSQEIFIEDIDGKKLPQKHYPVLTYFKVFKGKYLVSIIDETNLWVLPLNKDAKFPQGKHYNLGTPIDPKAANTEEKVEVEFIRWDSKPGQVVLRVGNSISLKKLDKIEEDFPDFNTNITEQHFETSIDQLAKDSKTLRNLKSIFPAITTEESPSLKDFPYPELLASEDFKAKKVEMAQPVHNQSSSSGIDMQFNDSSVLNLQNRSDLSKHHKLTWSAPNPYLEQYKFKPAHAYEEEEAEILASMDYRQKLRAEANKKKPFKLSGFQHPPKMTYNSLTDQHLAMFLTKTEVYQHLLKLKLVVYRSLPRSRRKG